jgi:hypothetical protein
MVVSKRLKAAGRAALLHFGASLVVALCAAWLVFGVWFPSPFDEITGGRNLFLILMAVDVVCGPVLTLVLFDPHKARNKWLLDLGLILCLQIGALVYGLGQAAAARPVFIAFEGDRFRIVQAQDVDSATLSQAPPELHPRLFQGPQTLGIRLALPTDADFPSSIQLSMQGLHPAFRPGRWLAYDEQRELVVANARSFGTLRTKHADKVESIDQAIKESGLPEEQLGYLPLVRDLTTDWIAVVRLSDASIIAYLHLDGW